MIRQATAEDMEDILEVWLLASLQAHDFVPAAFWWQQLERMRVRYLPAAELWVCEREGEIQGFIALVDDYLAALFVRPDCQQNGIGKALLAMAKRLRQQLELKVFIENDVAVHFYQQHGFAITDEDIDPNTGQPEYRMGYRVH
ncbi:GNAT family N-acetyltransferase [Zobellella maritima]|uniref:GNAT family N-acetyltransferase n=1 Tax=Zobellella maritima TaxID=2059725 RepID=UPI000E3052F7|nr:GNAT family N-acetyltransferase [Zobellella maritima]